MKRILLLLFILLSGMNVQGQAAAMPTDKEPVFTVNFSFKGGIPSC